MQWYRSTDFGAKNATCQKLYQARNLRSELRLNAKPFFIKDYLDGDSVVCVLWGCGDACLQFRVMRDEHCPPRASKFAGRTKNEKKWKKMKKNTHHKRLKPFYFLKDCVASRGVGAPRRRSALWCPWARRPQPYLLLPWPVCELPAALWTAERGERSPSHFTAL